MTVHDRRVVFAPDLLEFLEAVEPVAMAPKEAGAERRLILVVLRLVDLVAREGECPRTIEVDDRACQPRRVSREVDEFNVLEVGLAVLVDLLPVEVMVEVAKDVRAASLVRLRAVVGELQLLLVDEHRRVRSVEVVESARVVEMQVRLKHVVDVFDVVPRDPEIVHEAALSDVVRIERLFQPLRPVAVERVLVIPGVPENRPLRMVDDEIEHGNFVVIGVQIWFIATPERVPLDEVVEVAFQSPTVDYVDGSVDHG